ncbi:hypothetical protein BGW41_000659 [Actinomortierella wolfii]|nr:hypothetical protein BGW41_000659 [Actinomortierella wolfii]
MTVRRLYMITAGVFLLIVLLSYHKSTSVIPRGNDNTPSNNYEEDKVTPSKYNPIQEYKPPSQEQLDRQRQPEQQKQQQQQSTTLPDIEPNTSNRYSTLIVIPSSWSQIQNRKWVRDTLFGIKNNLTPCKYYNGNIIYKFYIEGKSTWGKTRYHSAEYNQALVRELHGELMEYNDYYFTNQTAKTREAIWGEALQWAVKDFIPNFDVDVTIDKVTIFDATTLVNLPEIEKQVSVLNGNYLYTWEDRMPHAATISWDALKMIVDNQEAIMKAYPTSQNFIHAAAQYYKKDAPASIKVVQDGATLWTEDMRDVAPTARVVGQIYQEEDWVPLAVKLAIQPTPSCAADHNRKVALLTSSYIYVDMCMAEASIPSAENKRTYCAKHGYDFVARGAEFAQEEFRGRRLVWGKISAVQKVLPHYEWILWMDMDAVIANMDRKVEDLVNLATTRAGREVSLIAARPVKDKIFNAGVFLIKNTDWSRAFLKEVQTRTEWFSKSSYEQHAMWDVLMEEKWSEGVYIFDKDDHTMNTFPAYYAEKDFIVHFAPDGCPAVPVLEALEKLQQNQSILGVGAPPKKQKRNQKRRL